MTPRGFKPKAAARRASALVLMPAKLIAAPFWWLGAYLYGGAGFADDSLFDMLAWPYPLPEEFDV